MLLANRIIMTSAYPVKNKKSLNLDAIIAIKMMV
jgi:hypothetical protein